MQVLISRVPQAEPAAQAPSQGGNVVSLHATAQAQVLPSSLRQVSPFGQVPLQVGAAALPQVNVSQAQVDPFEKQASPAGQEPAQVGADSSLQGRLMSASSEQSVNAAARAFRPTKLPGTSFCIAASSNSAQLRTLPVVMRMPTDPSVPFTKGPT